MSDQDQDNGDIDIRENVVLPPKLILHLTLAEENREALGRGKLSNVKILALILVIIVLSIVISIVTLIFNIIIIRTLEPPFARTSTGSTPSSLSASIQALLR